MDAYEVIKIVYSRVEGLEPENVSKIMGYFLFQDNGDQEMLRLALSPDALLKLHISKAKKELGLPVSPHSEQISSTTPVPSLSILPHTSSQFAYDTQLSPGSVGSVNESLNGLYLTSFLSPRKMQEHSYFNFHEENPSLVPRFPSSNGSPASQSSMNAFSSEYMHPDVYSILKGSKVRMDHFGSRLNGSLVSPDNGLAPSWKPCMYFARGYCKHGSTCRFLHSQGRQDSASSVSPIKDHGEEFLSPWSLEKLEQELKELLRGRRTPVSIASLPQLYFEKYGKNLQADGYLTESQRHGKAGFSLTKLLARLKNTVTLIDRPHGQHAVVLAEEAYKFLSYKGDHDDLVEMNPGSRQIYLTFPAESTFTEEDVAAHFRVYGPVQDVRIPYQQKRMFGFVTFVYPETVKVILARGNPHFVCGARVLVKPYKEKGKHSDRKLSDRETMRFYSSSGDSREYDFYPGPRFLDGSQIFRSQFEEQAQSLELERRRLAELQMAEIQQRIAETESHVSVEHNGVQQHEELNELPQTEELSAATDTHQLQTSSAFGYLLDVLDSDAGEEPEQAEKTQTPKISSTEGHNLPDSPFTSPHCQEKITNLSFLEGFSSLTLGEQAIGSRALTSVIPEGLICPLCTNFLVDPLQLDCKHTFCVQCILKVIRVSKDECPLCQRHIGSQIAKLLESRGLRVVDAFLTTRGGRQIIW